VIAAMTVGKDVSMLFTDVLNCIQTNNLELKKLVYLYVINHAKLQPDKAILAVNSFQRVTHNSLLSSIRTTFFHLRLLSML
jgi:AP-1 complex subunit beta-1